MRVKFWGTRGSIATPGPETQRFGGNTSCATVLGNDGTLLVLDAGTGIRRAGGDLPPNLRRIDLLLSHLHMDHIQGLGFFSALYNPAMEVHIWGPGGPTLSLRGRLRRYLSPPLFPVLLRDLPCDLHLHEIPCGAFSIGTFRIMAEHVCHPGPTVGYRIENGDGASMCYMPDHEPALGVGERFPLTRDWTSGADLAHDVDLLIHDAQYTSEEYPKHVGWGHSSLGQAIAFADLCGVRRLLAFHHDPSRDDAALERVVAEAVTSATPSFPVSAAAEGDTLDLSTTEQP